MEMVSVLWSSTSRHSCSNRDGFVDIVGGYSKFLAARLLSIRYWNNDVREFYHIQAPSWPAFFALFSAFCA